MHGLRRYLGASLFQLVLERHGSFSLLLRIRSDSCLADQNPLLQGAFVFRKLDVANTL